jgi:hypothetical protein
VGPEVAKDFIEYVREYTPKRVVPDSPVMENGIS